MTRKMSRFITKHTKEATTVSSPISRDIARVCVYVCVSLREGEQLPCVCRSRLRAAVLFMKRSQRATLKRRAPFLNSSHGRVRAVDALRSPANLTAPSEP